MSFKFKFAWARLAPPLSLILYAAGLQRIRFYFARGALDCTLSQVVK